MNRFKQIDVLRALAVFLVLGRHVTPCPPETSRLLSSVTGIWNQGGWVGVDLFFVLSGFLVSGLLFREHSTYQTLRIDRFLIRRGFKIYPAFWVLICATILLGVFHHRGVPFGKLASELLFVQDYFPRLWMHTWSLAVEEHFYFVLAFGFWILTRRGSSDPFKMLPVVCIFVALLCLSMRVNVNNFGPAVFASHMRFDSLFFGVFLSYLFHRHPTTFVKYATKCRYLLLALGALLLSPAFCFPVEATPLLFTYGLTLFYLASGCLLTSAIGFHSIKLPLLNAVAYGGSHSYSIYLWHLPVAAWGTAFASELLGRHYNWFIYIIVYLIGSITLGISMANLIEYPILRFRDRFMPSRSGVAAGIASLP